MRARRISRASIILATSNPTQSSYAGMSSQPAIWTVDAAGGAADSAATAGRARSRKCSRRRRPPDDLAGCVCAANLRRAAGIVHGPWHHHAATDDDHDDRTRPREFLERPQFFRRQSPVGSIGPAARPAQHIQVLELRQETGGLAQLILLAPSSRLSKRYGTSTMRVGQPRISSSRQILNPPALIVTALAMSRRMRKNPDAASRIGRQGPRQRIRSRDSSRRFNGQFGVLPPGM